MRKTLLAILVLPGLVLPAGCGGAGTPPHAKQPTVAESREGFLTAGAAAAREQGPVRAKTDEANRPAAADQEADGAAAGLEDRSTQKATGARQAQDTGDAAADRMEHSAARAPASVETPASPSIKPAAPASDGAAEPDQARPLPVEPNEPARPPGPASGPARFDDEYATLLRTYVREDGRVDYAGLNRRRLDLKALLTQIDELDPNVYGAWPREEKLAFWINACNVKVLEIITRNYPIQSSRWLRLTWPPSDIRHIRGIWTDYKFIVMDEEFTLAAVEQQVFDKTFGDPRVYLALAYAARSGPPLRREPYRGNALDRQLDGQVRRFLSSPQGLRIDRRNMVVRLSAIFKPSWHGKEFLARYATDRKFKNHDPQTRAVLSFLTNYLCREDVEFLEVENYALEYVNFDWRLHDASGS